MNDNSHTDSEIDAFTSQKETTLEMKKNKFIRALYAIGGVISLALAIFGIVVPGLPTTPFALLSAALFAKSSDRMYNWLLNNKILGPRIKDYQRKKGVTRKGKAGIIVFMSCMVLFSAYIVGHPLRIVILALGLIGGIVVWFFVPTAKEDFGNADDTDNTDLR
ncbi:MAG: YbaN family protein [Dysgonamonadaceae bacterium]|jgi:uncharacterized membrane protein YbaN (DUF454 family)|nr:YbaN family protein [Dysgonamonadaceae bacterium]